MGTYKIELILDGKSNLSKMMGDAGNSVKAGMDAIKKGAGSADSSLSNIGKSASKMGNDVSSSARKGENSLKSMGQSGVSSLSGLKASVRETAHNIKDGISQGARSAVSSLKGLGSAGGSAISSIGSKIGGVLDGMDTLEGLIGMVAGGFGLMELASMSWGGATQRQFNNVYLQTVMTANEAKKYQEIIARIVSEVPGDDTFMNALLTGALAKESSLTVKELELLGEVTAYYTTISKEIQGGFVQEYQREIKDYILTGNTGLMQRDGLLKNQVKTLEGKESIEDRILAINEALTAEGYKQIPLTELSSSKLEEVKGKFQLAATELGSKLLPGITQFLETILAIDESTGGLSSTIMLVAAGAASLGGMFGLLYSPLKSAYGMASKLVEKILDMTTAGTQATISMSGLGKSVAKIGLGLAAEAAALVGVAYLIGQISSHTAKWKEVEAEHNQQMTAYTNNIDYYKNRIGELEKKRRENIAAGRDTVQIDKEIADARENLRLTTEGATEAENKYKEARQVQKGIQELHKQRSGAAETSIAKYKSKTTGRPVETVFSPEEEQALKLEMDYYNKIDSVKLRYAGTLKRIEEGKDNYTKFWKDNKKYYDEYTAQYDEFVVSNQNFHDAIKNQDWGGIIWFGLERAFNQADVGLMEMHASIQSWWMDTTDWWKGAYDNTIKWFQGGWNDLVSGLSGAWEDFMNYWNDPSTIGGGFIDTLRKVYCWIVGCSPGLIPALKELWNWGGRVFNALKSYVDPVLKSLQDIWDIIQKIASGDFSGIFGKGGILDFKLPDFKLPDFGNLMPKISIPKMQWPDPGNILREIIQRLKSAIPRLNWRIPSIGQVIEFVQNKIPRLNWRIPSAGQLLSQTWRKISSLIWRIPGVSQLLSQTWQKISKLAWKIPDAGRILKAITDKIPGFRWPMGPGVSSAAATGVGRAMQYMTAPGGPIKDAIANTMSRKSGVGVGYIRNAMEKRFSGVSAFRDIANGISDHLAYQFYFGDQKSNKEVWDSGLCNCYDGAQFVVSEASQRFGLNAGMQNGFWGKTPHTWATVGGQPFDMAAKLIRGTWSPPSGPPQDFHEFMTDIGPGLEHMGYGGHLINPFDAVANGGNCFDMTLGIMGIANDLWGLPAQMVWGHYDGMSHVWAKIGNRNYDPTRRALEGTYNPPPQGPRPRGSESGDTIIVQFLGEVYGVEDLDKRTEGMVNQALDKRAKKRNRYRLGG